MPAKTGERVVSAEVLTTRSPVLSELDWYQLRKALRGYSRKSISRNLVGASWLVHGGRIATDHCTPSKK